MKTIPLRKPPGKILIVKPSSLGDIVHSLPFLKVVNTCFSGSRIHWVVAKGFEGLLAGNPMTDRLWIINKDAWKNLRYATSTMSEIKRLFRSLKQEHFDLVIDLQGLLRSGIITAATGSPVRVGFAEAREGSRLFYTHKVTGGKDIHAVDRYLKIAACLGCDVSEVVFPFPLSAKPASPVPHPFPSEEYAVLVPGARWKTKQWPPEKFGELSRRLPLRSLIVGSRSDRDIADTVASYSDGNAISLAGRTSLQELIEVIRSARFVVSNDSGPMHIAAALGKPVCAIFGPTDPLRTGPYGKGHTIIRENVPCAPCFRKTCQDIICMKNLSAGRVLEIMQSGQSKNLLQGG